MMKIVCVCVVAVTLMAGAGFGATINWQTDQGLTQGIVDNSNSVPDLSWAVVMYSSTNVALNTQIYQDGTTDDGSTLLTSNAVALADYGLGFGYLYDPTYSDASLGLGIGSTIFTVVFNSADVTTASEYAIVDDALFTIPDYGLNSAFTYDIGGNVALDWQSIPEPGTISLMLVGGAIAAVTRRRKAKKKV